jgi:OFA family oxalate/formate antiporter-like MFS transporter
VRSVVMLAHEPARTEAKWHYGWIIVALAIIFQVLVYGVAIGSFTFWTADWIKAFHAPRSAIIGVSASTLIISALVAPLVGYLLNKWPMRYVVSVGLAVFTAGLVLQTLVQQLWLFAASYSVTMGVALAMAGPMVTQALIFRWFGGRRGLANGIALCGAPLGGVLMPPLVAFLLIRIGWQQAALTIALLGAATIPLVLLVAKNPPGPTKIGLDSVGLGTVAPPSLARTESSAREFLFNSNLWILILTFLPIYAATMALSKNFALVFADQGFDPRRAAFAYSLMNIFSIVGKVIIGTLSDRYDHRILMFVCICIAAVGFGLMAGHPGVNLLVVSTALIGFGSACFFPMQGAIISRYFAKDSFSQVLGLLNFFLLFGALLSPIAGAIRDKYGAYDPFLLGAAVLLPMAALVVFRLSISGRGAPPIPVLPIPVA